MAKRAIIFDLDGTLWDASTPVAESWEIMGRKYFHPDYICTPEMARKQMGLTMVEIGENLTPADASKEAKEGFLSEAFLFEQKYLEEHPGEPFDKEETSLLELKKQGYALYVLSNCQKGYIENYLKWCDPKHVYDGHICFGDTNLPKSGTIRVLLEREHIDEAVYVGDTGKDEEQTHIAGLPFIHAAYGFGEAKCPEGVLHSIHDIVEVANSVFEGMHKA